MKLQVLTLILPYFNSIKVRLKQIITSNMVRSMAKFQFHKGTIKTEYNFHPHKTST